MRTIILGLISFVSFVANIDCVFAQCEIIDGSFEEGLAYLSEGAIDSLIMSFEDSQSGITFDTETQIPVHLLPDFISSLGYVFSGFTLIPPLFHLAELTAEHELNPSSDLEASIDSVNVVLWGAMKNIVENPFFQFHHLNEDNSRAAGIKLWAFPYADAYMTPFYCQEQPKYLRWDLKHSGHVNDSLIVRLGYGTRPATTAGLLFYPFEYIADYQATQEELGLEPEEEIEGYPEFEYPFEIIGIDTLISLPSQYETFEIALNYENYVAEWDTMTVSFMAIADTTYVNGSLQNESDFIIDNVRFSDISLEEEMLLTAEGPAPIFALDQNPVYENLMVSALAEDLEELQIFDLTGKMLLEADIGGSNFNGDVSSMGSGMYVVRVVANGVVQQQLFVKQ